MQQPPHQQITIPTANKKNEKLGLVLCDNDACGAAIVIRTIVTQHK